MTLIIIALILIHVIGLFIFKPKHTVLGCGIFAWAGKNPRSFSKDKFNILGIYNDSRGGHSCGVSVDGEIYNGVDKYKKYQEWVSAFVYDNPKRTPVVIGHTRFSTGGEHNVANAHPFGFGNNEKIDGYEFIGVHNGSLLNHKDFIKEFGVEDSERILKDNNANLETYTWRWKIDSELLLECIYKSGNFKVLSDYNGAAALVFTNTREPNVIYCYHGASKIYSYDSDEKIFEERPLWYYKKGKNDLYISSMPESLQVIGGEFDTSLFEFDHNTLYKITDGDIENAEKFRIVRKDRFQKGFASTYQNRSNVPATNATVSGFRKRQDKREEKRKKKEEIKNIHDEKIDPAKHNGKVYMERLRYKRNGHNITGIYTWIENYGFLYLSEGVKTAHEAFWHNVGRPFDYNEGKFLPHETGPIDNKVVPIPLTITNPRLMYFYKGVMLCTELDYKVCMDLKDTKGEATFGQLSWMSKHPILDESFGNKSIQKITKDDKLFTGKVNPLESGKIYEIVGGNLESITEIEKVTVDDTVIPLTSGIDLNKSEGTEEVIDDYHGWPDNVTGGYIDESDNFVELNKGGQTSLTIVDEKEEEIKKEAEIDAFLLDEKLDKVFTPVLMTLQAGKRDIQKFLPAKKAEAAVDTIDFFVESVEELVVKEEK